MPDDKRNNSGGGQNGGTARTADGLEARIAESVLDTARTSLASAQHVATTIEPGDAKAVTTLALDSFLFAFRAAIWTGVAMLAAIATFVAIRFPGLARERRLEAEYGGLGSS